MIIQTGMRTDIPAFYHEWLLDRIKEGYVLVHNPLLIRIILLNGILQGLKKWLKHCRDIQRPV